MKRIVLLLLTLLSGSSAFASTTQVSPAPKLHFVDSNGNACTGCKLFTYQAGTTTKLNTFTDQSGGTQNADPVILDSRGEANVWLAPATLYKFVLSPSTDTDPPTNAFYTVDNLSSGIIVPVTPAQGGTSIWFGGATTGTGNAQVLASVTPSTGFTLTAGYRVTFIAGASNSGATTLNVFGTGATAVAKRTTAGLIALSGNEIIANGVYTVEYDGTRYQLLDPSNIVTGPASSTTGTAAVFADTSGQVLKAGTVPTQTRETSSTGTYSTPSGVLYLRVRMVGGGGGGGGGGSGATNGGAGGNSTFGTSLLTSNGGGGGTASGAGAGAGGTVTGCDLNLTGSDGGANLSLSGATVGPPSGGGGGVSLFGGAGHGGDNAGSGTAGKTNTGSGGGGGSNASGTISGAGGGSGGYCEKLITSPLTSYAFAVGAAGTAGAAGTGGNNGGAGGSGLIIIDEFYQ